MPEDQSPPRKPAASAPKTPPPVRTGQVCPAGHEVGQDVLYCTECGLRVGETPRPWTCQHGHTSAAASKFCGQCGDMRPPPSPQSLVPSLVNPPRYQRPGGHASESEVHIHFVEDGFDFAGRVWYAGQEIKVSPASPRWPEAERWIRLTPDEQLAKWGKVYFRPGPYPQQPVGAGGMRRVPGS